MASLYSLISLTKSLTQSITKDRVHSPLLGPGNGSPTQSLGGVEGARKGRGRSEEALCLQQLPPLSADRRLSGPGLHPPQPHPVLAIFISGCRWADLA